MEYLKKLFSYDRWANSLYLDALSGQDPSGRGVRLLSHVVGAQMLWMDRILKRDARVPVWPEWTVDICGEFFRRSADEWRRCVASLTDQTAQERVSYKNSKGEPWESTVEDISLHVANHGTYHRAQIAALLRAAGITPPYTDYIEGVRRGHVAAE